MARVDFKLSGLWVFKGTREDLDSMQKIRVNETHGAAWWGQRGKRFIYFQKNFYKNCYWKFILIYECIEQMTFKFQIL